MSRINEKLGFKPAGKRAMMHLPKNRADAAALTSARCRCGASGIREYPIKGIPTRLCPHCGHTWTVDPR